MKKQSKKQSKRTKKHAVRKDADPTKRRPKAYRNTGNRDESLALLGRFVAASEHLAAGVSGPRGDRIPVGHALAEMVDKGTAAIEKVADAISALAAAVDRIADTYERQDG